MLVALLLVACPHRHSALFQGGAASSKNGVKPSLRRVKNGWENVHELREFEYAPKPKSLQSVMPIEWLHVPKTGSSFANSLIHLPGVCPGIKEFTSIAEGYESICPDETWKCNTSAINVGRFDHFGVDFDLSSYADKRSDSWKCTPEPTGGFNAAKGRLMMFVRQPEQRFLSEWSYLARLNRTAHHYLARAKVQAAGCMTKLLTQNTYGCFEGTPPTKGDVKKAIARVQTGFSFIGDMDRWNLSVCLFNKMFNQKCMHSQFQNSRPTNRGGHVSTKYDTADLNGWRDPHDNAVYHAAIAIFEKNLKLYKVNDATCEIC